MYVNKNGTKSLHNRLNHGYYPNKKGMRLEPRFQIGCIKVKIVKYILYYHR